MTGHQEPRWSWILAILGVAIGLSVIVYFKGLAGIPETGLILAAIAVFSLAIPPFRNILEDEVAVITFFGRLTNIVVRPGKWRPIYFFFGLVVNYKLVPTDPAEFEINDVGGYSSDGEPIVNTVVVVCDVSDPIRYAKIGGMRFLEINLEKLIPPVVQSLTEEKTGRELEADWGEFSKKVRQNLSGVLTNEIGIKPSRISIL